MQVKVKKMNCYEYQALVSAQIDGETSPAEVVEAERHLSRCPRCAALHHDLRLIVTAAEHLPPFEPEDRVWARLRSRCEGEGFIRRPPWLLWNWLGWLQASRWSGMAVATATLVVVIMVASVWLFLGRKHVLPVSVFRTSDEIQATQEVRQAEQQYLQAIDALQKISETRMAQMDSTVKNVLEDNLATIDYYIDKCRESVKNEPSNALAQRYLLEAYRKKVDLLASIVHSNVL